MMFTACFGPETPQETAEAFWEAVTDNDAGGAVRYSTLEQKQAYDGFGKSWEAMVPSWKKVVIEGDEARIEAEFSTAEEAGKARNVVTYLLHKDGEWKVDYERTASGLKGGVFATLVGELGRLGQHLNGQIAASSALLREDMQREMEEMHRQMDDLSDSLNSQTQESIEAYGEALRDYVDELGESAREALEENEEDLSEKEKRVLGEAAEELEAQYAALSDPDAGSIAEGSENAAKAQMKLLSIDEKSLGRYREKWEAWHEEFREQTRQFLDEMSAELAQQQKEGYRR